MSTLIRVVNQQLVQRSILIDKVDLSQGNSEGYAQRAKQKVYVPYANPLDATVKGYIDMVPTDEVLLSLGKGTIKGLEDAGYVSTTAFASALTATPTVSNAVLAQASSLVVTGTVLPSLSPDLTSVKLTNLTPTVQSFLQTAFSATEAQLVTLVNELKADINAHFTQATVHAVDDAVNTIGTADATDTASAITLVNVIKTKYNTHRTQATVHTVNDAVNVVGTAAATTFATAILLANEIKADYRLHRVEATVHSVDDMVNTTTAPALGTVSATQIIIPAEAITGVPTTGWTVYVVANSKTSNTFTMV